jgi:hypothetical protein
VEVLLGIPIDETATVEMQDHRSVWGIESGALHHRADRAVPRRDLQVRRSGQRSGKARKATGCPSADARPELREDPEERAEWAAGGHSPTVLSWRRSGRWMLEV